MARNVLALILACLIIGFVTYSSASAGLTVGIQADRLWYYGGEDITVYGSLYLDDAPLVGENVALEIHDPLDSAVITRSVQTDASGAYSVMFRLAAGALTGEYVAYVSCIHNGQTALNHTSFHIRERPAFAVSIVSEKQSYNLGEIITLKGGTTLNNIKQPQVLVALEVQNPNATPIVVRVLETDSQGEYSLTFPASESFPLGNYAAFASATFNGSIARAETSFELIPQFGSTDINKDGKVNIIDLTLVATAWGSYPGHPRWNPICDVNGDSQINIMDLTLVAKDYNP